MIAPLFIALLLSPPGGSPAPEFNAETSAEGIRFTATAENNRELTVLRIGEVKDLLRHGSALYAALAKGGLVVVDAQNPVEPVVTAHLFEGRPVVRLAHVGETILVAEIADRSSAVLDLADPLHPVETRFVGPPQASSTVRGRVIAGRNGYAMIEGGSEAGFKVGMQVRILSTKQSGPVEALAVENGLQPKATVLAVSPLVRVEAQRSLAQLGRGEDATIGSLVEGTDEEASASLVAPRRAAFNWRISGDLRPFANIGGSPAATGYLMDLDVQYYLDNVPLRFEAGLTPLGLALGSSAQHNPAVAFLNVAFATSYFELGVGGGFSVIANEAPCVALEPCSGPRSFDAVFPELNLRLGALDGLNLDAQYAIAWRTSGGFDFGRMLRATLNLPVARRVTVYAAGAGGTAFGYGEVGARLYLTGLGGTRTLILSGGIGGAVISDGQPEVLGGPELSLGVEARF